MLSHIHYTFLLGCPTTPSCPAFFTLSSILPFLLRCDLSAHFLLPLVYNHVTKDRIKTTESPYLGPHLLLHSSYPIIHSVTCFFLWAIPLAAVSSIYSHCHQSASQLSIPILVYHLISSKHCSVFVHHTLPFSSLLSHNCSTNHPSYKGCFSCRLWKHLVLSHLWVFTYSGIL